MQPGSRKTSQLGLAKKPDQEDKRLERLYDYTKFHIGIYLSAASGLAALIGSLANNKGGEFLVALVGSPALLGLALLFMVLAGACGGVVATSVTESKTFEAFWSNPQGPSWWRTGPSGSRWVAAEHLFFWVSLTCLLLAVLLKATTLKWLLKVTV
jgi:hypothetical protein